MTAYAAHDAKAAFGRSSSHWKRTRLLGSSGVENLLKLVFENQKVYSYTLTVEELDVYNDTVFERSTFY